MIEALQLASRHPARQARVFADLLGLPVEEYTADRLALRIGHSRLVFERDEGHTGGYHYALGVPGHRFAEAVAWLAARVPLLTSPAGQHEWFFEAWNAQGVYFADGDENIAELIAHHTITSPSTGTFGGDTLLGVSEIGLVVEHVPTAVGMLEQQYGLQPYLGLGGPEFTAVGDAHGMFIVVARGRPWLPTGAPAQPGWSTVTFQDDGRQHILSMT